jgi:D-alanine-D-alanine ligase
VTRRETLQALSIAVLLGGRSGEREISLASGRTVLEGLQGAGYAPRVIDTGGKHWWRELEGVDLAFNIQHGTGGEDGVTQGLLAAMGIVGTGSGVFASALAMDKLRCKQLWRAVGLPTADFAVVNGETDFSALLDEWGGAFIKPSREGSSLGMARVTTAAAAREAVDAALAHDPVVFAERLIDGPEYTVAVLGERALPPIRITSAGEFYDFEAKYRANSTRYDIPCGLDEDDVAALCELALRAFWALDCRVWGRVDVMRDGAGDFQLLEVNTIPGMTDHSLVPMAARAAGLSIAELLEEIMWLSWAAARDLPEVLR